MHNISDVVSLLKTAWDESTGLFAEAPGRPGDVKSSSLALTVAEQVGKLHEFEGHAERIRNMLTEVSPIIGLYLHCRETEHGFSTPVSCT